MKNSNIKPPRAAFWIIKKFSKRYHRSNALGDLEEMYQYYFDKSGAGYAKWWYRRQALRSVPFLIHNLLFWKKVMFRSHLKIALRNIKNHKTYSFINISGLAIGMACAVLIYLWIQDELSYDRFHENANQIYRVVSDYQGYRAPATPGPFAAFLKIQIPEIKNATRFKNTGGLFTYNNRSFRLDGLLVDKEFLKVFTFPLIEGNPDRVLSNIGSIVLTEESASKFFPESGKSGGYEDAMGKILRVENRFTDKVEGIVKNVPENSSPPLKFDYLYTFELLRRWRKPDSWYEGSDYFTFVLLEKNSSVNEVNRKIDALLRRNNFNPNQKYFLQPLSEIHLYSDYQRWDGPHGDIQYVVIFSIVAFFILIIACINYMNLSTARSMVRAREVGIRKVLGADRNELMKQFFCESVLFSCLALPIAFLLIELFLPVYRELSGKQLSLNYLTWSTILGFSGLVLFTGMISGIYPALFLSSFQPVKILMGHSTLFMVNVREKGVALKSGSLRNLLVVTQFALSIIIIICTMTVYKQLNFIRDKRLGFDKENLIYISIAGSGGDESTFNAVKNELSNHPGVISVSGSNNLPTGTPWVPASIVNINGIPRHLAFPAFAVDYEYLNTFKMEMAEGRFFLKEFSTDPDNAFIINESAARSLCLENPAGTKMYMPGLSKKGEIIGVVKDFHFESMHDEIQPLILVLEKNCVILNIRIRPGNIEKVLPQIKTVIKKHYSGIPLEFHFLNETIDQLYKTELRLGKLFIYFSILAVFISCLGLYGLASFIVEKRTKEIGVRKVLGASVPGVVSYLTKDFTKWIFIANLFAWPVSYYIMTRWLENFAYRINIGIFTLILSGILAFTVAVGTVSYQAFKAARSNPVDALRYE